MTKKPLKRRRLVGNRPLTFSSFSRSVARIGCAASVNRQKPTPEIHLNQLPSTSFGKKSIVKNADSDSEKSESSDDEEAFEGGLSKEAVFCDPNADDFHALKTLLRTYLDAREWDLSGFVDIILSQTTVGTCVKLVDDDDNWVYALLTVLNLHRYKEHKCIREIKQFLLRVCKEKDSKDKLLSLLGEESHNVGLLVSQCMMNFPPLPPLYDGVFDEISWATEDEPTEEIRKSFRFKHYILITRIEKLRNPNQKKRKSIDKEVDITYYKPEDEIFHELSLWSFTFPWKTQELAPHESKKYKLMGLVMIIEAKKIPEIRKTLHHLTE